MKKFNCVPCFVCDTKLETAIDGADSDVNQPDLGVAFDSTGNYGSTFFDSMDSDHRIEIAICDECLKNNINRIRESVWHKNTTRTTVNVKWNEDNL